MALAKIKINVKPWQFSAIQALAVTVANAMSANPGSFPLPHPALADLLTDSNNLGIAIANWGPVHNRGSHAQWLSLITAANIVYNDLLTESQYVQNLVDPSLSYAAQVAFIALSGFSVKNLPIPQGPLQAPRSLVRIMSSNISEDNICLSWKTTRPHKS